MPPLQVLLLIIDILAVPINAGTVIMILCGKVRTCHSSKLFVSLMLSHIVCATNQAVWIINKNMINFIGGVIFHTVVLTSLLSITTMTAERLAFIVFPFHHQMITKRIVYVVIALEWLAPGSLAMFLLAVPNPELREKVFQYIIIAFDVSLLVAMVTLISTNVAIWAKVRKQVDLIMRTNVPARQSPRNEDTTVNSDGIRGRLHRREKLAVTICFGIAVSFTVFWLPYAIAANWLLITNRDTQTRTREFTKIFEIVAPAMMMNCIADPVIYTCFNKKFRKEMSKACCCRTRLKKIQASSGSSTR